jgi:hypothetical protein
MTNTCPFSWNRSSKILDFTNIWYSFCRRLLRPADVIFFWKLVDETQISKPPEATGQHGSLKLLILLPLRADLLCTLHYEIPCNDCVCRFYYSFCWLKIVSATIIGKESFVLKTDLNFFIPICQYIVVRSNINDDW